ncbi:MAG: lipopolysaccharide kinase InaA family protein [Gemmatales bacterium]|nr:lipopolysaccharide kinase InaA family protein [Gemmatales bacterium]
MHDWLHVVGPNSEWHVAPQWHRVLFNGGDLRWEQWKTQGCLEIIKQAPHRLIYRVSLPHTMLSSDSNTVADSDEAHPDIYIKCYPLTGLRWWSETWHLSYKTQAECHKALFLRQQGLPTVEPIAFGRNNNQVWIVTLGLAQTVPLDKWLSTTFLQLPSAEQRRIRLLLPKLLARLIALMHQVGAFHHDLHAGNILIRYHPQASPELYITDTHAITLHAKPLSWRQARHNLILFGRWFLERCRPTDRRRFFHHYIRYRTDWHVSRCQERKYTRHLESVTWRSLLRFYCRREDRPWQNNRYFYTRRLTYDDPQKISLASPRHLLNLSPTGSSENLGGKYTNKDLDGSIWDIWAVAGISLSQLYRIIETATFVLHNLDRDQLNTPSVWRRLFSFINGCPPRSPSRTASNGTTITGTANQHISLNWQDRGRRGGFWETELIIDGQPMPVIVKAFRLRGLRQRLAELLHLGPASRSWTNAFRLTDRGFATARTVALLHWRSGWLPSWAFLICEKLYAYWDLHQALDFLQNQDKSHQVSVLSTLIHHLAQLFGRLHRHGLSYRDAKSAHILVAKDYLYGRVPDPDIRILDLVGLSRPLLLTRGRRVRNLARLQVSLHDHPLLSRTDRLRFLKAYLRATGEHTSTWKWWWRQIAHWSRRKIVRNERLARPLT